MRHLSRLVTILLAVAAATVPARAVTAASPGDLDSSFGTGGKVTTSPGGGFSAAYALAALPDGSLLAGGESSNDFVLLKSTPDGDLDTSFGGGTGIVNTDFPGGSSYALDLAVQPDGKILAAGSATLPGTGGDFAIARYMPDGTLDTSFSGDGMVTTDVFGHDDQIVNVALGAGGKILVGGGGDTGTTDRFVVARYTPGGVLDTSFSGDGMAMADAGTDAGARAFAVGADGKMIVAGFDCPSDCVWSLARFLPGGGHDTSFGTGGVKKVDMGSPNDSVYALFVRSDGAILAGGTAGSGSDLAFGLARFRPDGAFDLSFGGGDGVVTTQFSDGTDRIFDMAVQPDGKIVATGQDTSSTGDAVFAVARYTAAGALDPGFGSGGTATADFGPPVDSSYTVEIQPGGRIVVGGNASNDVALAGFVGSTGPDCTQLGTGAHNVLVGGPGADTLCGVGGKDTLKGLAGDDWLFGGGKADLLLGGAGDDGLNGGAGSDTCKQGPGSGSKTSCEN